MADIRVDGDLLPLPALALQGGPDFNIECVGHGGTFAKFCGSYTQPIAHTRRKNLRMQKSSIVQVVATALGAEMERRGLSANQVGHMAKVSPNTVLNFVSPDKRAKSAGGKQPSGKLTELEMIVSALGLEVAALFAKGSPDEPAAKKIHGKTLSITRDEFRAICDNLSEPEREKVTQLMAAAGYIRGATVEVTKCTTEAQDQPPNVKDNRLSKRPPAPRKRRSGPSP